MDTFSFSRLDKFLTCPYSFYRHYELGIKEPPTEATAFGKAVHAAIQAAVTRGIPAEEAACQAANAAALPVDPAEVVRLASAFISAYKPDPGVHLEVERKFVLELASGVKVRGFMDLLETYPGGEVRLTDFKTDRVPYGVRDTEQLSLYGWMLHRALGAKEVPARLVFLREPKRSRFAEEVLTVRDFTRARDWALSAVESIYAAEADLLSGLPEKLAFPPRPGRSCKFCPHVGPCLGMEMPEPGTADEAAQLAGTVLLLERALDAVREKLRPYLEQNGPVSVGGEVFLVKESSRLEVSPENLREIARIIQAAGGDPFQYLSLSGTALSRALRKHPQIKEDVTALVEEKPYASLRHEVEKKAG